MLHFVNICHSTITELRHQTMIDRHFPIPGKNDVAVEAVSPFPHCLHVLQKNCEKLAKAHNQTFAYY